MGLKIGKSFLIQLIVFILIVGTTIFLFIPVQRTIEEKIASIKTEAISFLESTLGREISYSEISPSFFRSIKIRGLAVSNPEIAGVELLEIRQLRIYYRLIPLLRGDISGALYQVRIENAKIVIDENRDADLVELFQELLENRRGRFRPEFVFVGRNLEFLFRREGMSASVSRVFTRFMRSSEDAYTMQLKGGVHASLPETAGKINEIDTELHLFGTLASEFTSADLRLRLQDVSTNVFSISDQNFSFSYNEEIVKIRKIQGREPIDLSASYDLNRKIAEFSIMTEDFYPYEYGTVLSEIPDIQPWLNTRLSGRLDGSYDANSGEIAYDVDLEVLADNRLLPFPVYAELVAAGNTERITADRALVQTYMGTVVYNGSFDFQSRMPYGIITMMDFRPNEDIPINGTIRLRPYSSVIQARSDLIRVSGTPFTDFTAYLSLGEGEYELRMQTAIGEREDSRISFEGNFSRGEESFVQGALELADCGAPAILDLFPIEGMNGMIKNELENFTLDTEIFFTTDLKQYGFVSPYFVLRNRENERQEISFSVAGNSETLEIAGIEAQWNDVYGSGNFTLDYSEQEQYDFSSELRVNGFDYDFAGILKPQTGLQISGAYDTELVVLFGDENYLLHAASQGIPFQYRTVSGEADFELYGMYRNADSWRGYLSSLKIRNGKIGDSYTMDASLKMVFDQENIFLQELEIIDQYSTLTGRGRGLIRDIYPMDMDGWLTLSDNTEREVYTAAGSVENGGIDLNLSFTSSPIRRFQFEQLAGEIAGTVAVSGALSSPSYRLGIETKNASLNNDKFELSAQIVSTKEYIGIPAFELSYLSNRISIEGSRFDHERGNIDIKGDFSGIFQGRLLEADLSIRGETRKRGPRKKLNDILKGDWMGTVSINPILYQDRFLEAWQIGFAKEGTDFTMRKVPDETVLVRVSADGFFEMTISEPLPFQLSASGTIKENRIEAELRDINLDIEALNTVLHIPYFDINRGTGTGNLTISGTLTDPDFSGKLQIQDGYAENPLIPVDLGPFQADLLFSGKNFTVPLFYISVETATVAAELDFIIDHWVPKYYTIELESVGTEGVPMVSNFSRMYVDGDVLINELILAGDFSGIDISGELTAKNMQLTLGEAPEQTGPSRFEFDVDLDVRTGKQIEFLWPSSNFPILQTFAEIDETVEISYNSLRRSYQVVGDVSTRGGQIFYFNRNFLLREASISFNEEQGRFDPQLTARADLREISEEGENVTIIMVVDQKPFSQFSPRFESDPPLPNNEVLAMLGQNIITQIGGEQIDLGATLALTGNIFLKQLGIMASIENTIRDILRLDLFSIRSQMLENLLSDRFFAGAGVEGDAGQASLGRYLDNTTLFLGKYLSDDIFLEAMLGLRLKQAEDEILYSEDEFQVDTEISLEWTTPLALLELSFMPDMTDLFGAPPAVSLALSWGFSF